MQQLTIREADTVYGRARRCEIDRHRVKHTTFGQFCIDVGELRKQVGALDSPDFWLPALRLLRRVRFEINAFPIPIAQVFASHSGALARTRQKLSRCHLTHPDLVTVADTLLAQLDSLVETADNPLLECIAELLGENPPPDTALLLKESRGVIATCKSLEDAGYGSSIDVIVSNQLRQTARYGTLIVVGPTKWYPDYVFTAPRASSISLVHFTGIRDRWKSRPVFLGSEVRRTSSDSKRRGRVPTEREQDSGTEDIDAVLDPISDVLPDIDFANAARRITQRSAGSSGEMVKAKLFLLDGGYAVLLDADDGAFATVVDLDQEPDDRVHMVKVRKIEHGMFIVLRQGGGGDYVVDVADQLLGGNAAEARRAQQRWKQLLSDTVRKNGLVAVCRDLIEKGAVRANSQNVRNWMSQRNIKTQEFEDFLGIMRVIGLEEEAQAVWETMMQVDRAHKTAGQRIRKMLISKIRQSDEWELQRLGRMDFSIRGVSCGGISVFRVIGMHDELIDVPETEVGQLLKDEGDEWR